MKNKTKITDLLTYIETLDKTKVYNGSISEVRMSRIGTKDQQQYLDKHFEQVDKRFESLETKVDKILDILNKVIQTPTLKKELAELNK